MRLKLRAALEKDEQGFVYSFWPDVATLKEIGDPKDIGTYFNLMDPDDKFTARVITAQCRQNTNYDIVRYAAHPFFLQGYTALANGENTFYLKNVEFQRKLNPGYIGFESDSQCFLYTLHYVHRELGWPLSYSKHVITPLPFEKLERRDDRDTLLAIRQSLAHLEINGPNTIIGVLPDSTLFTCCDAKKLRPIVVGRTADTVVFSSEVCGINEVLPGRDWEADIYPNEREIMAVDNQLEVQRWKQLKVQSVTPNDMPWKIRYDASRCTLCGSCVAACSFRAIECKVERRRMVFSESELPEPKQRFSAVPVIRQVKSIKHYCRGCGICEKVCPNEAIQPRAQHRYPPSDPDPLPG